MFQFVICLENIQLTPHHSQASVTELTDHESHPMTFTIAVLPETGTVSPLLWGGHPGANPSPSTTCAGSILPVSARRHSPNHQGSLFHQQRRLSMYSTKSERL